MRIAMAQIDTVVGGVAANETKIAEHIRRAKEAGAHLVVFPEMALVGYPLLDLVYRPTLLRKQREALERIAHVAAGIAAVVGFIDQDPARFGGDGRPLVYNAAALVKDGKILAIHRKNLLPEYDVFFERRYFAPGSGVTVVDVDGVHVGLEICEDLWDTYYETKVTSRIVAAGADVIVNISASPFHIGKGDERRRLLRRHIDHCGKPIVYVNQVGAEDGYEGELVFDGDSLAIDGRGRVVARAPRFAEALVTFDLDAVSGAGTTAVADDPVDEDEQAFLALVRGVKDYAARTGFKKSLLGLSGGIDSAVVAVVAAHALGPQNVLGISMPSRYSSDHSKDDARILAENLGIEYRTIPIEGVHQAYLAALAPTLGSDALGLTEENLQARIRGALLMAHSNHHNLLLLSTGNKTEVALGYCTLYGDMNGGLTVLADVSKERVYGIARHVNRAAGKAVIPQNSIDKVPSAELRPGQVDPFDYAAVSPLADLLVEDEVEVDEAVARGYDRALVERLARLVRISEYKRRQAAPGIRITARAFGVGRRMPISWPGE